MTAKKPPRIKFKPQPIAPTDYLLLPKSRAIAIKIGATVYYTGQECAHGHVAPRRTSTAACLGCPRGGGRSTKAEAVQPVKPVKPVKAIKPATPQPSQSQPMSLAERISAALFLKD